jgi:hypothetical protein
MPSKLGKLSQALLVGGAALLVRRGSDSRASAAVAGALMSAGGLAARWTVFKAGFESAADPKYVVGPQRELIERGERKGAARHSPNVSEVRPAEGSPATAPVELSQS